MNEINEKLKKSCQEALTVITKMERDELADIKSKLEFVIGSYEYDKNPVGLHEFGEKALRILTNLKKKEPRKVNAKVLENLENNIQHNRPERKRLVVKIEPTSFFYLALQIFCNIKIRYVQKPGPKAGSKAESHYWKTQSSFFSCLYFYRPANITGSCRGFYPDAWYQTMESRRNCHTG